MNFDKNLFINENYLNKFPQSYMKIEFVDLIYSEITFE